MESDTLYLADNAAVFQRLSNPVGWREKRLVVSVLMGSRQPEFDF